VCVRVCVCMDIYIYIYAHTLLFVCVCVCACLCVCACIAGECELSLTSTGHRAVETIWIMYPPPHMTQACILLLIWQGAVETIWIEPRTCTGMSFVCLCMCVCVCAWGLIRARCVCVCACARASVVAMYLRNGKIYREYSVLKEHNEAELELDRIGVCARACVWS
jgi:hypothetical protein